ncbi:hypothetical protein PCE31106_04074 [Pandoraea cepalis]|uniref:DUF4189 domain-containing protein n=1 Tax=Pandoraea cepalis TaxID=2508294 RepID=A0A5E4XTT4_9BURK|nr:DUF4189 domain-containing protein [Pandoraea cepalis]VVE39750.1 hypothetical protein PCE31106_04074 [Pandoraea cepalis]
MNLDFWKSRGNGPVKNLWRRFYPLICTVGLASVLAIASTPSVAASAVAGVRTASGIRYVSVTDQTSMAKAKVAALDRCRAQLASGRRGGRCDVLMSGNGPAYWAVVRAVNGEIGIALGDTQTSAVQDAFAVCQRAGQCSLDSAQVWFDSGQRPGRRLPTPQAASVSPAPCRIPTGQVVRMQTRCVEGACVRTYENGCTIRFQAAHCLDKGTSQYVWRPNGCDEDE